MLCLSAMVLNLICRNFIISGALFIVAIGNLLMAMTWAKRDGEEIND